MAELDTSIILEAVKESDDNKDHDYKYVPVGKAGLCGLDILYSNYVVDDFDKLLGLSDGIEDRSILINTIDDDVAVSVSAYVRFWNKVDSVQGVAIEDRKPIIVYINSNGGELDAGFSIYDTLTLSTTPIYTVNMCKAYSSGLIVLLGGHKRLAYPNSSFLIHQGACGVNAIDANKFDNFSMFYKQQRARLEKIIYERTKITAEAYAEHRQEDWWFFAPDALEMGVIDEVVSK